MLPKVTIAPVLNYSIKQFHFAQKDLLLPVPSKLRRAQTGM